MGRIKARRWASTAKMEPDFVAIRWDEASSRVQRRAECGMNWVGVLGPGGELLPGPCRAENRRPCGSPKAGRAHWPVPRMSRPILYPHGRPPPLPPFPPTSPGGNTCDGLGLQGGQLGLHPHPRPQPSLSEPEFPEGLRRMSLIVLLCFHGAVFLIGFRQANN